MFESMGPGESEGGYNGEPSGYSKSGGFGGYGSGMESSSASSGRLGDEGIHSWTESTGYFRKRGGKVKRQTPSAGRETVFARSFSCPAPSNTDSSPVSESSDVPAARRR